MNTGAANDRAAAVSPGLLGQILMSRFETTGILAAWVSHSPATI